MSKPKNKLKGKMKYVIFLMDGAADYPIKELGKKTPLQAANKPNIDWLAKNGRCGKLITIPDGFPKGSDTANLSILGYDPLLVQGRGVLEAANMGIKLNKNDIALRCNLINVKGSRINDYSAGHISSEEAKILINLIDKKLGSNEVKFFPGVSYRHILVLKNKYSSDVECFAPHDIYGKKVQDFLARAKNKQAEKTAKLINELILKSPEILEGHKVNKKRKSAKKNTANMIWPWSPGKKPNIKTFKELYNIKGAVISAVDLVNGIGVCAGFDVIKVKGATGLYDTNYEGKADAALKALKSHDFVYVHVEAPDEAGHSGDFKLKVKAIEDFDKRLVGSFIKKMNGKVCIAVLPDHPTPVSLKTHSAEPVPFLIYNPDKKADSVKKFDEFSAEKGSYGVIGRKKFIAELFS